MSWGDGIKAGIKGAAANGPAIVPYASAVALRGVVFAAYEALLPHGAAAAGLRLRLAKLSIELGYAAIEPDPLDPQARGVVLGALVDAYRPELLGQGPGQKVNPGSAVGSYSPMPPMSYDAPAGPLAKRAGDAIEDATRWAEANAAGIQLFDDLRPGVSELWRKVEDGATAAAVAAGEAAGSVMDPMRAELQRVIDAASSFLKWAGIALLGGAALWLATKRGGGKAADPWE